MVKCILMIGLPGSGKSEEANKLSIKYNAEIFSSDKLREEMFGDVNNQENNDTLFKELHKRIRECLSSGKSAICDSTNISYKRRMEFIKSLNKIKCEKIAVLMATPYEICIERNSQRERKVPEYVIKRMYMNFYIPYKYEGFDSIDIVFNGYENYYGRPIDFYKKYKDYNQHNTHHKLTLGDHCKAAAMYLLERCSAKMFYAAYIHDCGKPFCATFVNKKGEETLECHYYGHEHPSSYNALFYNYTNINPLNVAILVLWHMRPYLAWDKSENAMKKDKKLLGERLFNDILLLHEADLSAH